MEPHGDSYVLKDLNIDHGRVPEHQILGNITQRLKDTGDPRARHFLPVRAGGVVQMLNGTDDCTNGGALGIIPIRKVSFGSKYLLPAVQDQDSRMRHASSTMYTFNELGREEGSGHVLYSLRRHIRIVYGEIGRSITDLEYMHQIMLTLAGAACGIVVNTLCCINVLIAFYIRAIRRPQC